MKKYLMCAVFAFLSMPVFAAGIDSSMRFIEKDEAGNRVYRNDDIELIAVKDKNGKRFATIIIGTIQATGRAGFAMVPGKNFQEMSDNGEYAQPYTVDCERWRIYGAQHNGTKIDSTAPIFQTASSIACSVLESEEEEN